MVVLWLGIAAWRGVVDGEVIDAVFGAIGHDAELEVIVVVLGAVAGGAGVEGFGPGALGEGELLSPLGGFCEGGLSSELGREDPEHVGDQGRRDDAEKDGCDDGGGDHHAEGEPSEVAVFDAEDETKTEFVVREVGHEGKGHRGVDVAASVRGAGIEDEHADDEADPCDEDVERGAGGAPNAFE